MLFSAGIAARVDASAARAWDRRVVLGKKGARIEKDADYKSAIVRPRGRFISGVKV
ncbi:MAG: hypothetical protein BECKG1743E_GA0114224_104525, partial [Candidatus Kentron sp. G]